MLNEKTAIGPGLLFMLNFSAVYGYGFFLSMYFAAKYFGVNGIWGGILIFILMIPVLYIVTDLGHRFPGKSIIRYLPEITNAFPAKIIGFVYLVFLVLLTCWSLNIISRIFNLYLLPRTPFQVILGLILLIEFYITSKGIEGISRVTAFIFIFCLIFVLLFTVSSYQNFQLDNVLPIFDFTLKDLKNGKYFEGIIHLFNVGLPSAMLFMVYPYLSERRKGLKTLLVSSGLAVLLIEMVIISNIGIWGSKGVLQFDWPFMELGKQTNIPVILQTVGLFVLPIMLIQNLFAGSSFYFATAQGCSEFFGKYNYRIYRWFLLPIIFFTSVWTTNAVVIRSLFNYFVAFGFGVVFILPLFLWLIALMRPEKTAGSERGQSK